MLYFKGWILDTGWLFVLCLLLAYFWRERTGWSKAQSWFKVKGHITCFESTDKQGQWPKLEYSYHVYDKDWTGDRLLFDTAYNNPNSSYVRLASYKAAIAFQKSTEIDIYYNASDPRQSALDVRIPFKLNLILILISLLSLLHSGFMIGKFL
jgi:hypothetical protein